MIYMVLIVLTILLFFVVNKNDFGNKYYSKEDFEQSNNTDTAYLSGLCKIQYGRLMDIYYSLDPKDDAKLRKYVNELIEECSKNNLLKIRAAKYLSKRLNIRIEYILGKSKIKNEHDMQAFYEDKPESEIIETLFDDFDSAFNDKGPDSYYSKTNRQTIHRTDYTFSFPAALSYEDFKSIVITVSKGIKRKFELTSTTNGIIKGVVESKSGMSNWTFRIDFNDCGKLTGKYWIYSDNEDSILPKVLAERISEKIIQRLNN